MILLIGWCKVINKNIIEPGYTEISRWLFHHFLIWNISKFPSHEACQFLSIFRSMPSLDSHTYIPQCLTLTNVSQQPICYLGYVETVAGHTLPGFTVTLFSLYKYVMDVIRAGSWDLASIRIRINIYTHLHFLKVCVSAKT